MNQKKFNIFVSISNVLIIIISYICTHVILVGLEPELVPYTRIAMYESYELLMNFIKTLFCIMSVLNLTCIIQNIKNKRLVCWYIITIIHYINAAIILIAETREIWNIYSMYVIIILSVIFGIINFIIDVKKRKVKVWKIIIYILLLLSIISSLLLKKLYIILIMIAVMQLCNNTEKKKEWKIKKIFNILLFLITTGLIIYTSIKIVYVRIEWKKINDESIEFVQKVKEGILNEKNKEDNTLIAVKKNGKIGYINQKGEEVIACEYDVMPSNQNDEWRCIIIKKGNTYYTISKNGKIINSLKDNPLPYLKGKNFEKIIEEDTDIILDYVEKEVYKESMKLWTATNMLNIILDLNNNNDSDNNDKNSNDNIKELYKDIFKNTENKILESNNNYYKDGNYIYEFLLDNGNVLKIEEIIIDIDEENSLCTAEFNLSIWENNKLINQYQNIKIPWIMYFDDKETRKIESLKNEYVPYCDLKNKKCGLFYKSNFEKALEINGDFQILEVIDENRFLLRDYRDVNNIKKIIINKQGHILLSCKEIEIKENGYIIKNDNNKYVYLNNKFEEMIPECKKIEIIEDGYIIKKDNDKYVYLNNNFEEKTEEYNFIIYDDNCINEETKDLLLCWKNNNNNMKIGLIKKDGEIIAYPEYDAIGWIYMLMKEDYLKNYEYKNETKTYSQKEKFLLDAVYFDYYNITEEK